MKTSIRNAFAFISMIKWILVEVAGVTFTSVIDKFLLVSSSHLFLLLCWVLQQEHKGKRAHFRISTIYYTIGTYFYLLVPGLFQMKTKIMPSYYMSYDIASS